MSSPFFNHTVANSLFIFRLCSLVCLDCVNYFCEDFYGDSVIWDWTGFLISLYIEGNKVCIASDMLDISFYNWGYNIYAMFVTSLLEYFVGTNCFQHKFPVFAWYGFECPIVLFFLWILWTLPLTMFLFPRRSCKFLVLLNAISGGSWNICWNS